MALTKRALDILKRSKEPTWIIDWFRVREAVPSPPLYSTPEQHYDYLFEAISTTGVKKLFVYWFRVVEKKFGAKFASRYVKDAFLLHGASSTAMSFRNLLNDLTTGCFSSAFPYLTQESFAPVARYLLFAGPTSRVPPFELLQLLNQGLTQWVMTKFPRWVFR
jgi:hypothetical protein